jgi:hypothetical protein
MADSTPNLVPTQFQKSIFHPITRPKIPVHVALGKINNKRSHLFILLDHWPEFAQLKRDIITGKGRYLNDEEGEEAVFKYRLCQVTKLVQLAKFLVPTWGDIIDSGIELSYLRAGTTTYTRVDYILQSGTKV